MQTTHKRLLFAAIALTIVVATSGWARDQLGIALTVESVRAFAEGLGPAGPILFVFVVAGRALLALPSQVVLIAAGLCFGTLVGTIVGGLGLMLSGLALFLGARYAGREAIEKRIGPRARRILEFASHRTGAATLAIASGYPITPLSPIHAAAGLTPMPVLNFTVAAFVGGAIRSSIFAYFGSALADASWTEVLLAAGLFVLATAVPFAFPTGRSWLREIFSPNQHEAD
jgi:uncharacterized membrane protein YdjX (TVP38/TMEM64 family)